MQDILNDQIEQLYQLWQNRMQAQESRIAQIADIEELDRQITFLINTLKKQLPAKIFALDESLTSEQIVAHFLCFRSSWFNISQYCLENGQSVLLIAMLEWLPFKKTYLLLAKLLAQQASSQARLLALSVYRSLSVSPESQLSFFKNEKDPEVFCSWLRYFGEQGYVKSANIIKAALENDEALVKTWAAYAAVMLGDKSKSLAAFHCMVVNECLDQEILIHLFANMTVDQVSAALAILSKHEKYRALAPKAVAASGYLIFVDWLKRSMSEPDLAIESFFAICELTGIDPGDGYSLSDMDDEQEFEQIMLYQKKMSQWWQMNHHLYSMEARYLKGKLIDTTDWSQVFESVSMWQRKRISIEMAALSPESAIINSKINKVN